MWIYAERQVFQSHMRTHASPTEQVFQEEGQLSRSTCEEEGQEAEVCAGILGSGHPRKSLRRAASSLEELFSIAIIFGAGVPVASRPRGPGFPEYYWESGGP